MQLRAEGTVLQPAHSTAQQHENVNSFFSTLDLLQSLFSVPATAIQELRFDAGPLGAKLTPCCLCSCLRQCQNPAGLIYSTVGLELYPRNSYCIIKVVSGILGRCLACTGTHLYHQYFCKATGAACASFFLDIRHKPCYRLVSLGELYIEKQLQGSLRKTQGWV